jgi:hypothetical protein
LGMAPKGSSVIQTMLKRLAEEMQQKREEADALSNAAKLPKARAAAA